MVENENTGQLAVNTPSVSAISIGGLGSYVPTQAAIFDNKHKPGNNRTTMFPKTPQLAGQFQNKSTNSQDAIQNFSDASAESRNRLPLVSNSMGTTTVNGWKNYEDPQQLYQLQKYLQIGNIVENEVSELTRWKNADLKGNRLSQYLKETRHYNDQILIPVEQSRLEKIQTYEDRWPMLNLRKFLMKTQIYINIAAMSIDQHKAFEYTSIAVILLNCIQMAAEGSSTDEPNELMNLLEYVFLALYTLELVIKILAKGFVFNKGAYLRDAFNVLDFTIVFSGYLTIIQAATSPSNQAVSGQEGSGVSLNALRAFRVLRPLRSITAIKGLKILVQALLSALPLLKDTILVLIFFLLIFAIAGIQLISGSLKKRCINIDSGRMLVDESYGMSDGGVLCGAHKCPGPADGLFYCGKMNANPDGGVTNYDNIFWAFMNTFQNITLEGWSDTMLYYEMTSGLLVIVFFISSVFIGAFFLLNLTLAVINSSFSRKNEQFQKQASEERERKKKQMQLMANKQKDDDDDDDDVMPDQPPERRHEIGLTEFFIAKRAVRKMVDFYKRKREQRKQNEARLEQERQTREEAMFEENRPKNEDANKEPKTPTPEDTSPPGENLNSNPKLTVKSPEVKTVDHKPVGQSNITKIKANQIISLAVKEGEGEELPEAEPKEPKITPPTAEILKEHEQKVTESHPNQPQSKPDDAEGASFDESFDNHVRQVNDLLRLDSECQDKSNGEPILLNDASKLKGFVGNDMDRQVRSMALAPYNRVETEKNSIMLQDLGLDQMIAEDILQPQNLQQALIQNQDTKRTSIDKTKDINKSLDYTHPHYYSDDDAPKYRPMSAGNEESSVISSDTSFVEELERIANEEVEMRKQKEEDTRNKKEAIQRDTYKKNRMKRKLAKQKSDDGLPLNKLDLYDHHVDQDFNLRLEKMKSQQKKKKLRNVGLTINRSSNDAFDLFASQTNLVKNTVQVRDTRQMMIDNYKQVDDKFLQQKVPKNPYDYIDRKSKKIEINPGAKYISSSANEVLEPRQFNMWKRAPEGRRGPKQQLLKISKFLKPDYLPEKVLDQDNYIEPLYDSHQLKTKYEFKQVEQIEFDDDDEDALILAIQPYDTVRNVGFRDILQHLPIKLLTSRSDIIVSATMSITLTPTNEQDFTQTNDLGEEQVLRWVRLRNEFRAQNIDQAKLIGVNEQISFARPITSQSESMITENRSMQSSFYQSSVYRATSYRKSLARTETAGASRRTKNLPVGGLSKQLDPKDITELNEEAKNQYSKWQGKFEASQKILKHKKAPEFTLEDAKKMMIGAYEHENQEYDEKPAATTKMSGVDAIPANTTVFLNRTNLQSELDLSGFEQVLAQVIEDEELEKVKWMSKQFDMINSQSEIPEEIRKEFDLGDDITGNRINFYEVRKNDAARKRQISPWSGQDVLCVSYNQSHAQHVTEQMTQLRVWPKGIAGILKRSRFLLKQFIISAIMDNLMTLAVFLNTVVMALDRYGLGEEEDNFLNMSNSFFTWVFIVEFVMKIVALGPKKYMDNRMNLLDGSIVMLSLLELAMGSGGGTLTAFRSVRVFRTFRVLRVARILRSLKSMQQIMSVMTKSASSFAYIAVLLMIFLFIFSLLGKQIFGGRFNFEDGKPRGNYDSFNVAFLTSFQTLTMENWNSLLYDAIKSDFVKFISCVYYISWIFVGNFILLNLFLAILLDSFLEEDEADDYSDETIAAEKAAEELKKKKVQREKERRLKKLGQSVINLNQKDLLGVEKTAKKKGGLSAMAKGFGKKKEDLIDDIDDLNEEKLMEYLVEIKVAKDDVEKEITFQDAFIDCENSLYVFSQQNQFRKWMLKASKSKFFDNVVMGLIVLSSVKLALDSYIVKEIESQEGFLYKFSFWSDTSFTIMFFLEMIIKIISMGFIMDEGSYLRETWNQLDFFIVISSLFDLFWSGQSIGFIKVVRILRILRPLRFISHNKAMKMIVAALLDSGGSLFNVIIVIMVVWLMFAILAINLFAGKFFYCSEDPYLLHSKTDCLAAGHQWLRYDTNFDNVLEAMKALFILASLEGWPDIMYQALDATGIDQGPEFEHQIYYGYFFILFILIGSFFFLNFMIGVLFLKYTQAQKEEIKSFSQEQMNWMDIQKMIENAEVDHKNRYQPRDLPARLKLWKIVNSDWFERTIMTAILLNMVQMACSYDGQPDYWQKSLQISNYVFSSIFLVEAVLKLGVYGRAYFYTSWNKFDFFVVSASILDVLLDSIGGSKLNFLTVAPQLARVLRVLRVTRVLRLAGKNEGLQALLMTIQMSVTSLLNVASLLMLIFFMFSVLGVSLFQQVQESDDIYTLQSMDPEYKNFKNWHNSFILIFVLSTGENWPLVMYDVSKTQKGVNCGETTCGSSISILFFFVFVMIVQNIMLNLFILVIIQQFEQYYVSEDNPIQKFKRNLTSFVSIWIELTERQNHVKIKNSELSRFMRNLPSPIGVPIEMPDAELNKQIVMMGIRSQDGYVDFNELLYRCMRKQYGQFKLNRAMTVFELKTQFRLLKIREKNWDGPTHNDQRFLVEKMKGKADTFNPFMMQLFSKITFNRWLNIARNEILKREHTSRMDAVFKECGDEEEFKPSKMPEIEIVTKEEIINLNEEETVWITASEDEDEASNFNSALDSDLKKPSRSGNSSEIQIKSPEVHIMKSKHLKYSFTKRFRNQRSQSPSLTNRNGQLQISDVNTCKNYRNTQQLQRLGLDDRFNIRTSTNTERVQRLKREQSPNMLKQRMINLKGCPIQFDN